MNLRQAATYFLRDSLNGWNGTTWVNDITKCTLLSYDRFVTDRDYVQYGRVILLAPEDTTLNNYSVVRFDNGKVYLVGVENYDTLDGAYSKVVSVYQATHTCSLVGFTKTVSASGVAGRVTRSVLGTYHCNIERVTFSSSKEFDATHYTDVLITLPRDCPVTSGNELVIEDKYYDILESFEFSGYRRCRALEKTSA